MRTTLTLHDDAYALVKAKANQENVSLGKAASKLILQTVQMSPAKSKRSDAVFCSGYGCYTSAHVEEVLTK